MNALTLTDEERHRFAEYCRLAAHSNRGLAEQMKALPGEPIRAIERKYLGEAEALDTVAAMLESVEIATIGPKDPAGTKTGP